MQPEEETTSTKQRAFVEVEELNKTGERKWHEYVMSRSSSRLMKMFRSNQREFVRRGPGQVAKSNDTPRHRLLSSASSLGARILVGIGLRE